ncbi:hypothetical protein PC119_g20701 [Phytophthora cactorum]|nr:hypothetical protein PC112_g5339 [Phytophthora cactorum]KAG2982963.1 hypothetical protein PC119_g20701 [Phytophthora cactorum]
MVARGLGGFGPVTSNSPIWAEIDAAMLQYHNPLGGWHLVCCPFRNFKIFHPCVFFLTTVVYCSMSPKKRLNKGDSYKSSGKKVSASAKKKIFKVKKEPAKCWFL